MNDIVVEQIFPSLTWRIRQQAMYPSKEVLEMKLADDFAGTHFGLYLNHELTGVVSLFADGDTAQFRKMAILHHQQRRGLGNTLLQHLIAYCKKQGIKTLWCNARTSAIAFYTKNGFTSIGEAHEQNQIQYIKMQLTF
jgi:N-acetylglutamate synthase-like GNAT family acetyltransferase